MSAQRTGRAISRRLLAACSFLLAVIGFGAINLLWAHDFGQPRVVLLDEYQDTSIAQRRLLQAAFGDGHPVTAVGDPCQAIYGFRGASVDNIDNFTEHFRCASGSAAGSYSLAENHRSAALVIAAANQISYELAGNAGPSASLVRASHWHP